MQLFFYSSARVVRGESVILQTQVFYNRPTNTSAKTLNTKMKDLRTQVGGLADFPFLMLRLVKNLG